MDEQHQGGYAANRWQVIAAYGMVCAATQVLWLSYAAITTSTAKYYGVSVGAVGWLAEIFPLLYVLLAIPAGICSIAGSGRRSQPAARSWQSAASCGSEGTPSPGRSPGRRS